MSDRYNVRAIEEKWQKIWTEKKSFEVTEDSSKPKYYVLAMFPYPSGVLHMGHVRNYSLSDGFARFKKAQGYNVLNPMGWDAFGLPAENAAMERGVNPADWTMDNIVVMKKQMQRIGFALDWSREFATCTPEYYKHEQKFFLDFLKEGLAYQKEAVVNWDPVENTVLANEQVIDGRGERSGAVVEKRKLKQWFIKTTAFADELLDGIQKLDKWPEKVRIMQENWIGKSKGLQFRFDIEGNDQEIEVYTTRPDTLFGASFIGIAADHPLAEDIGRSNPEAQKFIEDCKRGGTSIVEIEKAEKKGFDTGLVVKHPFIDGKKLSVFIANFVLMDYGTGAIFGCPAHDQRDLEFARKYDLEVVPVILPPDAADKTFAIENEAYTEDGALFNSDFLNGMSVEEAKAEVIRRFEEKGKGSGTIQYRLRDWGVSRQRYWGCPIPVIYCEDCGVVPVPEDQLPVTLPADISYETPGNPLANHPTWKDATCPACGKAAQRETDTFDGFFENSWYQFRFTDASNSNTGFDKDKVSYWAPIDQYIGGSEHSVGHLMYSRFFTKALKQCGYLDFDEPFSALLCQGMVTHECYQDQDGKWLYPHEVEKIAQKTAIKKSDGSPVDIGGTIKMSKSKRNTIDPMDILDNYGADATRLFVISDSPPERDVEWTESGVDGAWKYVNRLHRLVTTADFSSTDGETEEMRRKIHQTTHGITKDYEQLHFNKAIARFRELSNALESFANKKGDGKVLREGIETLILLMAPVMPHLAEELWAHLGHDTMVIDTDWPMADESLLQSDSITIAVQVNGKVRATISLPVDASKEDAEKTALEEEAVQRAVGDKTPKKVIVVPNRIVNVVV